VGPLAVLDDAENFAPTGILTPNCPDRSKSLYRRPTMTRKVKTITIGPLINSVAKPILVTIRAMLTFITKYSHVFVRLQITCPILTKIKRRRQALVKVSDINFHANP
jgi:hypothetical protein